MTQSKIQSTGVSLALCCLILIGAMPVVANARPDGTSALTFTLFLSLWQLAFSLPLAWRDWSLLRARPPSRSTTDRAEFDTNSPIASKPQIVVLVGTGLLFGLSTYLYVLSVEKAGAVNSAIATQAYPLFAILLEALFLGRRKTLVEMGFTLLLLAALVDLATAGSWRLEFLSFWFVFALSIPFIWSIAHISLRQVMTRSRITPGLITFVRVLVSSILLAIAQLSIEGIDALMSLFMNGGFLLSAALMGFVYYAELVLWFHAVQRIEVSLASSITVPAPALTMVFAMVFLGDTTSLQQILAFAVVVFSLYGLIYANGRKAKNAETV